MNNILSGLKSFVHSLSTNDHYASYDPDRAVSKPGTGPQDTTRLTRDSEDGGSRRSSSTDLGSTAYTLGRRSQQLNQASSSNIALTELSVDGPPVPSPELSWERIDKWLDHYYPELAEQLLEGATANDLDELEHDLDCTLPVDVRESYLMHDGQERGGKPTGVIYGITLLDMEGVSEEWSIWRKTAVRLNEARRKQKQSGGSAGKPGPSNKPAGPGLVGGVNGQPANNWIARQQSFPPEAVQAVYAHPSWIPLAKDFDGNNIAVDLAPGPRGRLGQVILFGREFDTKFVIAPSWGDFLAQFAADLESGAYYVDDSSIENAIFAYKQPNGRLASYFTVLRQRAEKAHSAQYPPKDEIIAHRTVSSASLARASAASGSESGTPRLVSPAASVTNLTSTKPSTETVMKLTPKDKLPADTTKTPAPVAETSSSAAEVTALDIGENPAAQAEAAEPVATPVGTASKAKSKKDKKKKKVKALNTEPETEPETEPATEPETAEVKQAVDTNKDQEDDLSQGLKEVEL